ncbi:MAG: hypothetical protein IKK94_08690 [Clostridia bacterium]|nr:hypothetical protein [Clostridia bacterium]
MIKKFILIWIFAFIMFALFGCDKSMENNSQIVEDTDAQPMSMTFEDGVVISPWVEPGERNGARWHYLYADNDILSAVRLSDAIARVKVGNFEEEKRYHDGMGNTTFEVEITECIKGSLSGKVYVAWDAYSEGANAKVELPFYGDELIVFLAKNETGDGYSVYCDIDYDVIDMNGQKYCVSRHYGGIIYQLSQLLPDYHLDEYPFLVDEAVSKLNERTIYWNEKTGRDYATINENSIGEIYLLSDFVSLIEYILNE